MAYIETMNARTSYLPRYSLDLGISLAVRRSIYKLFALNNLIFVGFPRQLLLGEKHDLWRNNGVYGDKIEATGKRGKSEPKLLILKLFHSYIDV